MRCLVGYTKDRCWELDGLERSGMDLRSMSSGDHECCGRVQTVVKGRRKDGTYKSYIDPVVVHTLDMRFGLKS